MTRINVSIPPSELNNKHLIAEHREIKRIPNMVSSGKAKIINIPKEFTLGTGHVKFFYDKLEYLRKRYEELYEECLYRNFNVTYYGNAWDNIPKQYMNDYIPTKKDGDIIRQRINDRLNGL
jgi:deoxyribonuclease (pyrimidine dimer)